MCRRRVRDILIALVTLSLGAAVAPAQPASDDSRAGRLEAYLRDLGARELLAEHLRARLDGASGREEAEIAERIGRVYAEMLADASPGVEQDDLIRRSADLLERVPAADTFDLRIALTKARYLTAERIAERARLKLATDAEIRSALEAFDSVAAGLGVLGEQADRRVRAYERRERSGGISDLQGFRAELAELRRQRSLAKYYAGWALYYTAMLTGRPGPAGEALDAFGYLLSSGQGEPTLEKLSRSLLRHEHVARAAMGTALCLSARGEHVLASLWIEELETGENVNAEVLGQLFTRKVTVLAAGRRWDALAVAVERRRGAGLGERAEDPLRVNEARLLAIEVLEALRAPDADRARRDAAEPIAQAALGDLVSRGESAQVLDLVDRYGTLPLGEGGFVVRYVRALRAFRAARDAHREACEGAGCSAQEPTEDPALVAAYLEAADLLTHAFEAQDAAGFTEERINTGLMLGGALYYKGSALQAADRFEQTVGLTEPGERHAEALRMMIVSLEHALEQGRTGVRGRLEQAVLLFTETYPGDDNAARLVLKFGDEGLFDTDTVVRVLRNVGRGSPSFAPARQQIANVLYRAYAGSDEPERSEAAARFVEVALPLIDSMMDALRDPETGPGEAGELSRRVLVRIRQVLEASLSPLAADPVSARRALAALDELHVRTDGVVEGQDLEGELAFRRLQLAVNESDEAAEAAARRELESVGGRFLDLADTFLFGRALERWRRTRRVDHAREVVAIGGRLLGEGAVARADLPVADTTAEAATAVWRAADDRGMLSQAVSIDERVLADHTPTSGLLRRLAKNAEDGGDAARALELWQRLSNALVEGRAEWYEARYESFRLLAETDPAAARRAIGQHVVLHPMYGPSPWGERIEEIHERLKRGRGAGGGP